MHSQQHLYAVDLILKSKENQSLNLVSLLIFNEVRHIEINVAEVNNVILFHIFYVVEVKHEFVSIIAVKYDIKSIINEIDVNYDLKGAVKTVAEPSHIGLSIDLTEVSVIYIKLLLKFRSDAVGGQSVKESRQDNGPILTSLRKQSGDISITDLIQQCSTHHIYKKDFI